MLRLFQISLMLLVSLGSIVLASAEGIPLAALTCVVALGSMYFVDWARLVRIPPWGLGLLGLAAFLVAGGEFFFQGLEWVARAGAHLVVYLTWVILLQTKQYRQYWWLFALSVLQLAMAAVLTDTIWFGFGVAAYFFLAIWTLSMFLLCRSVLTEGEIGTAPKTEPKVQSFGRRQMGRVWNGLSRDVREPLVSPRFVMNILVVSCLSLLLSLVFFLYTPRVWSDTLSEGLTQSKPLTGFTKDIQLGSLGEILENDDHVMTVRLFHATDNRPLSRVEYANYFGPHPLFRGGVLELYEQGRWRSTPFNPSSLRPTNTRVPGTVIQQITLQPIGSETIFSFGNPVSVRPIGANGKRPPVVNRRHPADELIRGSGGGVSESEFTYEVRTEPGSSDASSARARSVWLADNSPDPDLRDIFRPYLELMAAVPKDLSSLRELTRTVVRGAPDDAIATQKILEWLRDSEEFKYTMKLDIIDPALDPVEDFLKNRHEGHCEYFASAMVLMLRSIGIPARMISGFMGGVYVEKDNAYHVQQLHAHAWVEAYLGGEWKTFDPTPGLRNEAVAALERGPIFQRVWATATASWTQVSRMDSAGQSEFFYEPIRESFLQVRKSLNDIRRGNTSLPAVLRAMFSREAWSKGTAALFLVPILLGFLGIAWLAVKLMRLVAPLIRSLIGKRRSAGLRGQFVPFFERFRSILRRHGIVQRPQQTAREFVGQSLAALEPRLVESGMQSWPAEVVENFYRVRFGGQILSAEEAADLTRRLDDLDVCLKQTAAKST